MFDDSQTRYKLAIVSVPSHGDIVSVSLDNKALELRFVDEDKASRPEDIKITDDLKSIRKTIKEVLELNFSPKLTDFKVLKDGVSFQKMMNFEGDLNINATMGLWSEVKKEK